MKMIQVRNVPDDIHLELKVRAARGGVSLSEYVLELARRDVSRPTVREWLEQTRARPASDAAFDAAEVIRAQRGPI